MQRQRPSRRLAGFVALAALAHHTTQAFLLPASSPLRAAAATTLQRPSATQSVCRRAVGGAGEDGANAAPGQGEMPDLERVMSPFPLGGESEYEFQSEYPDQQAEIEMYGDDELLQRYRDEMQASNDQYQLEKFMQAHAGTWSGVWSEYTPQAAPAAGANGNGGETGTVFRMTNIYKGRQECVGDFEARVARWRELTLLHAPDGGPLAPAVVGEREMLPHDFRSAAGSMEAENVFSTSALRGDGQGGEVFEAEVWIREGAYRTRVNFLYGAASAAAPLALEKLIVKKERFGKQGPTAEEPELFGAGGRGIYDPTSRTPGSWDLTLHGGLSLSFPPELPRGQKGAVIVDWVAGRMRYQADRIFNAPDGTLYSLEVTSIGSAESMLYTIEAPPEGEAGEEGAAAAE